MLLVRRPRHSAWRAVSDARHFRDAGSKQRRQYWSGHRKLLVASSFAALVAWTAALVVSPAEAAESAETVVGAGVIASREDPLAIPVYVGLRVNGIAQLLTVAVLLDEKSSQLWLNERDLRRMRLRVIQSVAPKVVDGQRFFSLANIGGASFEFDGPTQRVSILVPPTAYESDQTLGFGSALPQPSERGFSAYATYDAFAQRTGSSTSAGAIFDVEAASPWGVLSATQFISRSDLAATGSRTRFGRLDTTFTMDFPARPLSVRFGDFIANGANTTGPVRVGGVQVASNFTVRPGFVTYPTPTIAGQASLPSVAELFVNGTPIARQAVDAGPFTINNVAAVSGLGEITLLVRDVLGREQIVVTSFYGSSQLLAPGLSEYSLSAGKLRYNYGIASNDYRDFVGTGFWRYGVTSKFTSAINAELSRSTANAGIGATFLIPGIAEANASTSFSHSKFAGVGVNSNNGHAFALGIDRSTQSYGIGARYRYSSAFHRTVADRGAEQEGASGSRLRREFNAYASVSAGSYGSFTANYLTQFKQPFGPPLFLNNTVARSGPTDARVFAVGYNISLNRYGQISIGASSSVDRNNREPRNKTLYVNYFVPLGPLYSLGVSTSRAESTMFGESGQITSRNTRPTHLMTVQKSLPEGEGYGFRAQVGNESVLRFEGMAAMRLATIGLEYAQSQGSRGIRASASGAISTVGGRVNASRRIADSFAVIDAGGFPGVRVYLNNNLVGRTDIDGRLFIPSLRSYQAHTISIEATDLPIAAEIDQTTLEIVTARSTGTALAFPVRRSSSAQLRLLDHLGIPISAGSVVRLGGRTFPVAQDGEVFLVGLQATNELSVRIGGTGCRVQVPFVASSHVIPHLGTFTCRVR